MILGSPSTLLLWTIRCPGRLLLEPWSSRFPQHFLQRSDTTSQLQSEFLNFRKWIFFFYLLVASHGLSLVAASRRLFSSWIALASHSSGFFVMEHRLLALGLSNCGAGALVSSQLVDSFPDRDRTCVPCICRQIVTHSTTREVQRVNFFPAVFWTLL